MAHYTLTVKNYLDEKDNILETPVTVVYKIRVEKDRIEVNGRFMPVVYDREFTYKLQKTQIKSRDLPLFFSDYAKNQDGCELGKSFWSGGYELICEHVVRRGKTALQ